MSFYEDIGIKHAKKLSETKVFITVTRKEQKLFNLFVCIIPAHYFTIIWLPMVVQGTGELDQLLKLAFWKRASHFTREWRFESDKSLL